MSACRAARSELECSGWARSRLQRLLAPAQQRELVAEEGRDRHPGDQEQPGPGAERDQEALVLLPVGVQVHRLAPFRPCGGRLGRGRLADGLGGLGWPGGRREEGEVEREFLAARVRRVLEARAREGLAHAGHEAVEQRGDRLGALARAALEPQDRPLLAALDAELVVVAPVAGQRRRPRSPRAGAGRSARGRARAARPTRPRRGAARRRARASRSRSRSSRALRSVDCARRSSDSSRATSARTRPSSLEVRQPW